MKKHLSKIAFAGLAVAMIVLANLPRWSTGLVPASGKRKPIDDFRLAQIGGGTWRLSDHRGQVVLLNFWATWCPPCRQETPGLVRLANEYSTKGVSVVGIALDDSGRDAIQSFAKEFNVSYPIALPAPDFRLASSVDALPTTLLLDREGRVAKSYQGAVSHSTFQADVDKLLAEKPVNARR